MARTPNSPDSNLPDPLSPASADPHKAADDKEVVYFDGSPKLRGELEKVALFGGLGLLAIVLPFLYSLMSKDNEWPAWYVTLGLLFVGLAIFLIPVIQLKTLRYRISNYRIDYERGLLTKRIDTLELWHVEDVAFKQTLTDRMMNVGTITIFSGDDTTPELALHSVPDPRAIFENLKQRIIAVKRQRGVIKMDVG